MATSPSIFSRIRRIGSRLLGALVGGLLGLIAGPILGLWVTLKNLKEVAYGFVIVVPAVIGAGVVIGLLGGFWEGVTKGLLAGLKVPQRYNQLLADNGLRGGDSIRRDGFYARFEYNFSQTEQKESYERRISRLEKDRYCESSDAERDCFLTTEQSKELKQSIQVLQSQLHEKSMPAHIKKGEEAQFGRFLERLLEQLQEYQQYFELYSAHKGNKDFNPITLYQVEDGKKVIYPNQQAFEKDNIKKFFYHAKHTYLLGLLVEVEMPVRQLCDIEAIGVPETVGRFVDDMQEYWKGHHGSFQGLAVHLYQKKQQAERERELSSVATSSMSKHPASKAKTNKKEIISSRHAGEHHGRLFAKSRDPEEHRQHHHAISSHRRRHRHSL